MMLLPKAGRVAVPLLGGGTFLSAGGLLIFWRHLKDGQEEAKPHWTIRRWRDLPVPVEVLCKHLQDPEQQRKLGYSVAPWSVRLWQGFIDHYFAHLTVPLFEIYAPFPGVLPWFGIPRKRSSICVALKRVDRARGHGWILVSLIDEHLSKNDEGALLMISYNGLFYCGRQLGEAAVPGSDGYCGPNNGPQCASCMRWQSTYRPPSTHLKQSQDILALELSKARLS
mmetsp:Transcript_60060/g.113218  ORF Transcript_60060/g.113218 Transcript_60060/m.113218 type:complete len:225 (-) Transcript_60060:117-791(-)